METLKPRSAAEVLDAVRGALAAKMPLELLGGGTKRAIGRPVRAEGRLELSGLAGIRLYEPEELVLTAHAGTPLRDIVAALDEHGQHLGFEPPDWRGLLGSSGEPTLVGALAANLGGPRRIAAGAARDHLLGFSAVSGRGEVFKSGGRAVKNVTGYDLSKLMAGSWGTLAALTEVSIKVLPRPETAATLVLAGIEAAAAVDAMTLALGSPQEVGGAAWVPGELAGPVGLPSGAPAALLRLEGPAPSVRFRGGALAALLAGFGEAALLDAAETAALWRAIGDAGPLAAERDAAIWRISVPPSAGATLLAAFPEARGYLDWGGGLVWLALPPSPDAQAGAVRAAVARHGGHATLLRAEAAAREAVEVFQPLPPPLAALSRRVKESFDPQGLLNPRRMYREF